MQTHPGSRIGIIGGGQLGQMLILSGKPLGLTFGVLDPDPACPAASLADEFFCGSLTEDEALTRLVEWADITTFEIEHTNTDVLRGLGAAGHRILPDPALLALINDKYEQKRNLSAIGIPVPAFWLHNPGSFPVVQKLRRGGYDGRGVAVLQDDSSQGLTGDSYFEEMVDLSAEFAVLVARAPGGQVRTYHPVDMLFHTEANILKRVTMPSRLPDHITRRALQIAEAAIAGLGGVGVHAVEMFVTPSSQVFVNEIAPRPHNSGHVTIEANETSQFEQHLRAIAGFPLGSVALRSAAVSVNLLGAPGAAGRPDMQSITALMAHDRAHVHWYGKQEVRPFRKMGHVTLTADRADATSAAAEGVENLVWIGGKND